MYVLHQLKEQKERFERKITKNETDLREIKEFIRLEENKPFSVPEVILNTLKYSIVWIVWELEEDRERLNEIKTMFSLGIEQIPKKHWSPTEGFSKEYQQIIDNKLNEKEQKS